jgi:hypothetical protein
VKALKSDHADVLLDVSPKDPVEVQRLLGDPIKTGRALKSGLGFQHAVALAPDSMHKPVAIIEKRVTANATART